ncbi:hypothetical protein B0H13DRAFT_2257291 [Mycena leptocephala]|nr:hypothetical protein B0H13DRAFT_2257291 [Mycena leptocephala]
MTFSLLCSCATISLPLFLFHPALTHILPPRLPLEVVINIIEEACDDQQQPTAQFLKQCALVCRDWSIPAQKLLFSSVSLATQKSCVAFTAAVDRATPRAVRLSHHSFAHAVIACPNLLELNLALYGCSSPGKDVVGLPDVLRMRRPAPSFDENTLDLLRAGPSIRALQFSNWSENSLSISQLLDVWPSLKSLTELRMNFQTSPSVDFMKWLLHNSTLSLRVLELEREPSAELLDFMVEAHGRTLRSLALPACTSHDHALAVHKCLQLRELRVENPWATPLLYKRLPAGMQHVALALDQDTSLQPIIDAVRSGDSLKAVTLQVWESGERNPQLPVLKLVCAYRGIDLQITKDIRLFRSIVDGINPISAHIHPLHKAIIFNYYILIIGLEELCPMD